MSATRKVLVGVYAPRLRSPAEHWNDAASLSRDNPRALLRNFLRVWCLCCKNFYTFFAGQGIQVIYSSTGPLSLSQGRGRTDRSRSRGRGLWPPKRAGGTSNRRPSRNRGGHRQRGGLVVAGGSGGQEGLCCSSADSCVPHPAVGPKHVLRYTVTDALNWTF